MSYECNCLKIHSDMERIEEAETSEECIRIKTMHISCQSDTYQPRHNYAGVIGTTLTVSLAISSFKILIQKM